MYACVQHIHWEQLIERQVNTTADDVYDESFSNADVIYLANFHNHGVR